VIATALLLGSTALAQARGDFVDKAQWQGNPSEVEKQLWMSAFYGKLEQVQQALQQGASPNFKGKGGFTPVVVAAVMGHLDVVQYLAEHGADINKRDNIRHKNALLGASFRSNDDVAAYLLAHGAEVNAQGVNGWTPLHDAAFVADYNIVKMLVEHGADTSIKNNAGMTALQCAKMGSVRGHERGWTNATPEDYQKTIQYLQEHTRE
jgi:ankyrin repeat protein